MLNYGRPGSGKTYALKTLPPGALPVHIDSFDPGGYRSISDAIEKWPEKFMVDSRWENEDDYRLVGSRYRDDSDVGLTMAEILKRNQETP